MVGLFLIIDHIKGYQNVSNVLKLIPPPSPTLKTMVISHFAKRVSRRTVPVAEVLKMALGGCDTNIVTQAGSWGFYLTMDMEKPKNQVKSSTEK